MHDAGHRVGARHLGDEAVGRTEAVDGGGGGEQLFVGRGDELSGGVPGVEGAAALLDDQATDGALGRDAHAGMGASEWPSPGPANVSSIHAGTRRADSTEVAVTPTGAGPAWAAATGVTRAAVAATTAVGPYHVEGPPATAPMLAHREARLGGPGGGERLLPSGQSGTVKGCPGSSSQWWWAWPSARSPSSSPPSSCTGRSSHRAITMSPGLRFTCRALTWIMTGIKPREWVAVHRRHHAFTDVEGDPHSPVLEGFATVQIGNVVLYRRAARDRMTVAKYARDLPARPVGQGPVRPRLCRPRRRRSASCS